MPMALLILGALFVPPALAYFGVIGGWLALIAEIAILFLAAWNLDRGRRLGARDPFLDRNRADFATPMATNVRPIPTGAVEAPSDRRTPT